MTAPNYGDWIAHNATPDSTCPPDAVGKWGQVQCSFQTRVAVESEPVRDLEMWEWGLDGVGTIIAPAPADRIAELEAALAACVQMLDDLVKESGRQVEYGEEDPFRRGEWFELADLEMIELARAALKGTTDV